MKIISITTDHNLSLVDVSEIKHQLPYARRIPNQKNYYYVFDDGDALSEGAKINTIGSAIAKDEVLGDVYIVKSYADVTGIAFEDECISCTEDDLELMQSLYIKQQINDPRVQQ